MAKGWALGRQRGEVVLLSRLQPRECGLRSLPLSSRGESLQELRLPLSKGLRSLLDSLLVADVVVHDRIAVAVDLVGRHAGLPVYALEESPAGLAHRDDDTLGYSDLLALLTSCVELLVEIDQSMVC